MKTTAFGVAAASLLLALYLGALTLVSGWDFTVQEFWRSWYYVIALAAGFGVQVALFVNLREFVSRTGAGVVAVSGTTSTAAMISCCAHYLANAAPVLGAAGLVAFAAQFREELFWLGLVSNAAGIAYIGHRLYGARRHHASMA